MAQPQAVAGLIEVNVNGKQVVAAGAFTYMIVPEKKEKLVGPDRVYGHKVTPLTPYIEGELRDYRSFNLIKELYAIGDASDEDTVTLKLRNGKTITLHGAIFAGDGAVGIEESTIPVRFEGDRGEEVIR